jgi:hypothetical protein
VHYPNLVKGANFDSPNMGPSARGSHVPGDKNHRENKNKRYAIAVLMSVYHIIWFHHSITMPLMRPESRAEHNNKAEMLVAVAVE